MNITFWGTRGSLPSSGPDTHVLGGNTACVSVTKDGHILVLDAGSGIRLLGQKIKNDFQRIDILITHLHMDHIQGLGFFAPLYDPDKEIHIWGPSSFDKSLPDQLTRYLSPPLFPVRIRDLPCKLTFHEVPNKDIKIGPFQVTSDLILHPGPTVGYRVSDGSTVVTYLPDHEPALGHPQVPQSQEWTSGYDLAKGSDLLIHDAQFTSDEYAPRVGWGHSTFQHALQFASLTEVKKLVLFHHDPSHSDNDLTSIFNQEIRPFSFPFHVSLAREGESIDLHL